MYFVLPFTTRSFLPEATAAFSGPRTMACTGPRSPQRKAADMPMPLPPGAIIFTWGHQFALFLPAITQKAGQLRARYFWQVPSSPLLRGSDRICLPGHATAFFFQLTAGSGGRRYGQECRLILFQRLPWLAPAFSPERPTAGSFGP